MLTYLSLHQHSHRRCFLVFLVGEALTECPGRGEELGPAWSTTRTDPGRAE